MRIRSSVSIGRVRMSPYKVVFHRNHNPDRALEMRDTRPIWGDIGADGVSPYGVRFIYFFCGIVGDGSKIICAKGCVRMPSYEVVFQRNLNPSRAFEMRDMGPFWCVIEGPSASPDEVRFI